MQVKTSKLTLLDGIELKSAVFQGKDFPAHFHDTFAITVIEKGCERVYWQGKEMVQYANTVSIINPYEVHSNRFFDTDAWHYKSFYLNADAMRFLLGKKVFFSSEIIENEAFATAILDFHTHGKSIDALLPFLQSYAMEEEDRTKPETPNALQDICFFMQQHRSEKLSVENLAAQCRMDKFKFIRAFKKEYGITPIAYLLLYRIQHAKILLQSERLLTQVALESGFYDQSHFIHCFKKYIGVTPNAYKDGLALIKR